MTTGLLRRSTRGRAHACALVLAVIGPLALASPATAQVTVDELEQHYQLGRTGSPLTQVIPVRNEVGRSQQVRVVLGDWQRDSLGRNEFLEVGKSAGSCGDRITVSPMTFRVDSGATEFVRVTVAPGAAQQGCWGIVLFESVEPPRANATQGSFVSISVRTGVKIYVHAPNEVRAGELTFGDVVQAWVPVRAAAGARRDSTQVWQAHLRFQSAGTAHLTLKPTVEIRSLDGTLRHRVTAPDALLTPKALRELRIDLPTLEKGTYLALMMVDFGGDEITAAQVEFTIP